MIQLRSYLGKELDRSVDERENIWRYDIYELSNEKIDEFAMLVMHYKPKVVFSYASALETICDYLISCGGYPLDVKSVLVGAEALTESAVEKFRKVFQCPVFDRYSDMEMGILAQREFGKSDFKLNKASYAFECLKLNEDIPEEEGKVGRLVFTDLYNHAFPMIRYDTGDLGTYRVVDGEVCIEKILGRSVDQIVKEDGSIINFGNITNTMWGVKGIIQWQLIQNDYNDFEIRVIPSSEDYLQDEVIKRLKTVLGNKPKIRVVEIDEIPVSSSQKRKSIVNRMK